MRLLLLTILIYPFLVLAQEAGPEDLESPPPEMIEETLAPEVTIIQSGREIIKEHRINGRLYMIEITPKMGRTYYLVDADGDGDLETRYNDLAPEVAIPAWVLKRW